MLLGVLGGVGEYLHQDPNLVRVIFVLLLLATGAFPFGVLYVVMYFLIPEQPPYHVVDEQ